MNSRLEQWHYRALLLFFCLLGIVEAGGQVGCVLVLVTCILSGRFKHLRLGLIEVGLLVWLLSGLYGLSQLDKLPSSGKLTRPLMVLSYLVGRLAFYHFDQDKLSKLAKTYAGALTVNGFWGLLQLKFGQLPLDSFLLKNPRSNQLWAPKQLQEVRAAAGLYYNRLKLAHMGVPALGLWCLFPAFWKESSWLRRAGYLLAAAILLLAVLWTHTRMAFLAGGLSLLIVLVLKKNSLKPALVSLSALLTALAVYASSGYGKGRLLGTIRDFDRRQIMLEAALKLWSDHPWLGIGHGAYHRLIRPYMPENRRSGVLLDSPHNLLLQIACETGIVGLLGFSVALAVGIWALIRRLREREASAVGAADQWALFVLIFMFILGLAHHPPHHAPVALLFYLGLGWAGYRRAAAG